jgi:hypothetical protein
MLRLYLTVEEWAEIVDRQERADRHLPGIRAAMVVVEPDDEGDEGDEGDDPVYGDTYGGTWTDRESGRLVVAATSFDEQPFSFAEQDRIKYALAEELARQDIEFELIAETSPTGRHLILTVPKPDAVEELVKSIAPDGAVRIVQGPGTRAEGATDTVHSAGAQQPGLRIEVYDEPSNPQSGADYNQRCTWGVNGHTNTYNYLITAGHCLDAHPNHVGRLVRNSMASQVGDSGSGMLGNGNTIDGIHVAGSGSNAYFVTAYDVKRLLGFDYNCASTAVARAANQWGSCPIINR